VWGALFALASLIAPSPARAAEVIDSTFCLEEPRAGCGAPVESPGTVSIGRLPLNERGQRVVYFYSFLRLEPGKVALLVTEREGGCYGSPPPKLYVNPTMRSSGWASFWEEVEGRSKDFSLALGGRGLLAVGVVPTKAATSRKEAPQGIPAVNERFIACPARLAGQVLDADGKPLAGRNELKELTVTP